MGGTDISGIRSAVCAAVESAMSACEPAPDVTDGEGTRQLEDWAYVADVPKSARLYPTSNNARLDLETSWPVNMRATDASEASARTRLLSYLSSLMSCVASDWTLGGAVSECSASLDSCGVEKTSDKRFLASASVSITAVSRGFHGKG